MGHVAVWPEWIGEAMIPKREIRHLTVTVDGDERDATWKQGVGIYVSGHDFGKGDTVEIEGTPHAVRKMIRLGDAGEPRTIIQKAEELG